MTVLVRPTDETQMQTLMYIILFYQKLEHSMNLGATRQYMAAHVNKNLTSLFQIPITAPAEALKLQAVLLIKCLPPLQSQKETLVQKVYFYFVCEFVPKPDLILKAVVLLSQNDLAPRLLLNFPKFSC